MQIWHGLCFEWCRVWPVLCGVQVHRQFVIHTPREHCTSCDVPSTVTAHANTTRPRVEGGGAMRRCVCASTRAHACNTHAAQQITSMLSAAAAAAKKKKQQYKKEEAASAFFCCLSLVSLTSVSSAAASSFPPSPSFPSPPSFSLSDPRCSRDRFLPVIFIYMSIPAARTAR